MIPVELSKAYTDVLYRYRELKKRVDTILTAISEPKHWLYESRIKSEDSVYEKLVAGEYRRIEDIEDLIAATVILPVSPSASVKEELTKELERDFEIRETRSNRANGPTIFVYDDLHLILSMKDTAMLLNKGLVGLPFELQVKSHLQYAWSQATHDTVYKATTESWRANRVAAQTMAALELVEAALNVGEDMLPVDAAKQYKPIDDRVSVGRAILKWWKGEIPSNNRRLCHVALKLMSAADLSLTDFVKLLHSPRGTELAGKRSLSLQEAIVILLLEESGPKIVKSFQSSGAKYLLITNSMENMSKACEQVPSALRIDFG